MQYYVISAGGQKFGPADAHVLNGWVKEGRILPQTQVEELGTGRVLFANQVPGLMFSPGEHYQTNYVRPAQYNGNTNFQGDKLAGIARGLAIAGLLLCSIFSLVGIGYAIAAIRHGSTKGTTALVMCIGAIVLQLLIGRMVYEALMNMLSGMTGGI
ncbi:MAG: hypothetical protein WCG75_03315 [Armatimonadota bacterium]